MSYNPQNPNGQAASASSAPVVLSTTQEAEIGIVTETAPATDTASSGLNGRLQRIAQRLTSLIALLPSALVGGRLDINNGAWLGSTAPTVGQKTMANSIPTVIASDQSAVPVSVASLPLPSGAATETTLGTRLSESDFDTKTGSLTETAPATDTASSGLNGRLQRIAQRLTSLIALLPSALVGGRLDVNNGAWLGSTAPTVGQKTMANSLPVVVSSDQSAVPVSAASLPLPSGAATSANQSTEITSLSSIDGKLVTARTADYDTGAGTVTTEMQGIALPASGGPVAGGTATNPIRTDPTGTTTQPVSVASLPLPTGAATETTLGTRLSESDFDTKTGSLTETAPATDTASSGLNGRLQRIAQRLTSLIALLPSALVGGRLDTNVGAWLGSTAPTVGQKTMANSVPVTVASDQSALQVVGSIAHDGVDSGNPVKVGFRAVDLGATPTAVATADRTDALATRAGIPFVLGGHPNILTLEYQYGTAAATDFKMLDVSTGTRIVVVGYSVMVSAACSVNVACRIGFGDASGDTTLDAIGTAAGTPTATQMVMSHPAIAPGSGVLSNAGSMVSIGGDGCDLFLTVGASTGGKVNVIVWYFTIATG
jgi:hypothetical protein